MLLPGNQRRVDVDEVEGVKGGGNGGEGEGGGIGTSGDDDVIVGGYLIYGHVLIGPTNSIYGCEFGTG